MAMVRVKEALVVPPSEPTPSRTLTLSALDSQLFLRFTIEYLLIYRQPPVSHDQDFITARVKSALARALVPYYPLAGRVRAKPDGSNFLEVVCRSQGAVFIEAQSDELTVSDFEQAPAYVTTWRNLLSLHVDDVLEGSPPLVVQLTWLSDGAAALGVGFNHCLCDGIGSAEFLNSFSELARCGLGQIKPKPVWDRHLLRPLLGERNSFAHPEFERVPDLCGFTSRFTHDKLTPTSISFNQTSLNELKEMSTSPSSKSSYTSFEALTAHVWRTWARALNLPPNQILKLLFSVNVRNRLNPSLPAGYYGNGFVLGCALTNAKDLTKNGLGYATSLVRKAKERVAEEYVRSVVEAVSESSMSMSPDSVGVLIVSQWSRLGLENVDFGMGKPVHVGPICSDRYCLMLPVYGERESVKVMVAVPTSAVDKYEYLLRRPCN